MNQFYRNLALWMLIALAMVFLFNTFRAQKVEQEDISFSDFSAAVDAGKVKEVTIKGQEINGKYTDNAGKEKKAFQTYAPDDPDLVKNLRTKNVKITARPLDDNPWYMTLLVSWMPMLLLIGVWIFFMRQMRRAAARRVVRKEPGETADGDHAQAHLRGRAGSRRQEEPRRSSRSLRIRSSPGWAAGYQGRSARGAWDREDAAGEGDRRGGGRSVLLDQRV